MECRWNADKTDQSPFDTIARYIDHSTSPEEIALLASVFTYVMRSEPSIAPLILKVQILHMATISKMIESLEDKRNKKAEPTIKSAELIQGLRQCWDNSFQTARRAAMTSLDEPLRRELELNPVQYANYEIAIRVVDLLSKWTPKKNPSLLPRGLGDLAP